MQASSKTDSASPPKLSDPALLASGSFISNTFTEVHEKRIGITNPATGANFHYLPEASDADVSAAISAASSAFEHWRHASVRTRADTLRRWYELLLEHKTDLAQLLTLENGKPLPEAEKEVLYGAGYIRWHSDGLGRGEGNWCTRREDDMLAMTLLEPVGVCLLITPWNFPVAMMARKAAAAVAAGCSIVAKPSELTPLCALAMAELGRRAGLPAGVMNVVVTTRAGEVVERILKERCVRAVSFTGSTRVGKLIAKMAAERVLKCGLELGGHAPFIVYDDADLEVAVKGLVMNKFRVAGQTCVAANRVFVQNGVREEFCGMVKKKVGALRLGNGMSKGVDYGPLINKGAMEKVSKHVGDAVEKGAKLVLGGKEGCANGNGEYGEERGYFYEGTVLDGVTDEMEITKEETFGPVIGVMGFDTEEEVLARANGGTEMGLAAYVFTKDLGRANRAIRELEFGMVGVNSVAISDPSTSFGGMKESGIGREGGREGLELYTHVKFGLTKF